jgi:hypothetical protein
MQSADYYPKLLSMAQVTKLLLDACNLDKVNVELSKHVADATIEKLDLVSLEEITNTYTDDLENL